MPQRSLPRAQDWSDVINNSTQSIGSGSRDAFLRCITERDFIGCLIVQEIMWNPSPSPAIHALEGGAGSLGGTFARMQPRKKTTSTTPWRFSERSEPETRSRFDDKVYRLHLDVMTTLAQMLRRMQGWTLRSLPRQLCEAITVRGQLVGSRASRSVAATVSENADMLGIPGEVTLRW